MSTLKQRERMVTKGVAAMDKAAEALFDLEDIDSEFGLRDTAQEEHFRTGLRERARYWERCTWWQKLPDAESAWSPLNAGR